MEQGRQALLGVTWMVLALLAPLRVALAGPDLEPDTLPVPPVPSVAPPAVGLPGVPRFELPPVVDGRHDVRELRVRRDDLLGTELTVQGYVVWIYDCEAALARPGVPAAETRLLIDDNPQLCERPKFYLGATSRGRPEAALWVVDVPRKANKREVIALNAAQLGARPPVPRLAMGDLVAVTGTFALRSPHGEQNTDGLLVYKKLEHLQPNRRQVAVAAPRPDAQTGPVATSRPAAIDDSPMAVAAPMRAVVPTRSRNQSIAEYERCNQALDTKQLDAAITTCRQAVVSWSGNHLAWYALGNAFAARESWGVALDAYGRAAQLRPDAAMYQLYSGIAQYKTAVEQAARDDRRPPSREADAPGGASTEARSRGFVFAPYQLITALTTVTPRGRLDAARSALAAAARLAPRLWLAWYYLGRTEHERGHDQQAAEAFTRAIEADAAQAEPYMALIQLYRAWDFTEQTVALARHASSHVLAAKTASLWYEIGMAYEAMRHDPEALAAFGTAIAAGSTLALFQRGQVYFRTGRFEQAKRDLEKFLAAPGTSPGPIQQIARSLLIAATREPGADRTYLRVPRHYDGP